MVKPDFYAFLRFCKVPKMPILQGFSGFLLFLQCVPCSRSQSRRATNCATPRCLIFCFMYVSEGHAAPKETCFLLQLRLCLPSLGSVDSHQVAATPYSSLHPPPAALGNVPNCATPRCRVKLQPLYCTPNMAGCQVYETKLILS